MNTFSKLYDTELHNQEIKSNKRTLMGFCWFFLTLLLVWVLTMINFFLISKFLISLSLGFTVLLLISPVIIYKKADLSSPWIKYFISGIDQYHLLDHYRTAYLSCSFDFRYATVICDPVPETSGALVFLYF